jgi:hypothetical protein
VGLEPTKTGFADRRLDHFGIVAPKSIPSASSHINASVKAYIKRGQDMFPAFVCPQIVSVMYPKPCKQALFVPIAACSVLSYPFRISKCGLGPAHYESAALTAELRAPSLIRKKIAQIDRSRIQNGALYLRCSASLCCLLFRRDLVHCFVELSRRDNIVPHEDV